MNQIGKDKDAVEPGYSYIDYNIALYLKPNSENSCGARILLVLFLIDWLYSLAFFVFQIYLLSYMQAGRFDHREVLNHPI